MTLRHILALSVVFLAGCPPEKPEPTKQIHSESGLSEQPVLVVDGEEISVAELDDRVERLPSYARSRLASVPARQKHLDAMADFELLADEAERRGYGEDPRVVHAVKEALARQARERTQTAGEEPGPPSTLKERREQATIRLKPEDVATALQEKP